MKTKRVVKKIPFRYVHPELIDERARKQLLAKMELEEWKPQHKTEGSACSDFRAIEHITIPVKGIRGIRTGIAAKLPDGYELAARSRSGLFINNGVFCVGTIDDDYTGEIKVLLANFGDVPFVVNVGDRVAQFKLSKYVRQEWELTDKLPTTERGAGGFGSTGVK